MGVPLVFTVSLVLPSAGPLELRELNEVPVDFCHIPAAWG